MPTLAAISISSGMIVVFAVGLLVAPMLNWAIYRLAWQQREFSPWGPTPQKAPPRTLADRIPIFGWLGLRREVDLHGRGFWIRPMMLELLIPLGLAALYGWEVDRQSLILLQSEHLFPAGLANVDSWTHATFLSHFLLIGLMLVATFIDIDEKIIPDEITVPGTILGLLLAAALPISLLPHVGLRSEQPTVGQPLGMPALAQVAGNLDVYLESVTLATPHAWPDFLEGAPRWQSLALGLGCWWLWCFALAPRIWRGRHGVGRAVALITRRVVRELFRPPLLPIAAAGTIAIPLVWWWSSTAWIGLLSALVGSALSGGMIWMVRIVGTAALKREAMGFGDVTLMMMVGAFLGWQAGVMIFFLAPFAGLVVGLLQLLLRQDDVIPYGPFLCLASLFVMVFWGPVWTYQNPTGFSVQDIFATGGILFAVLIVCFAMLGIMLAVWQAIKTALFSRSET